MPIDIKGQNSSLVFRFNEGTFEEYVQCLREKVDKSKSIFEGFQVTFKGEGLKKLAPQEIKQLQIFCLENGIILNNFGKTQKINVPPKEQQGTLEPTMIFQRLRSGQKIYSENSVIIWGNVHETAEVYSNHNVVVMGFLEGMAHAGCNGNENSFVFALDLYPRQIRIAEHIARLPSNYPRSGYPEMALLEEGQICIKEYGWKIGQEGKMHKSRL